MNNVCSQECLDENFDISIDDLLEEEDDSDDYTITKNVFLKKAQDHGLLEKNNNKTITIFAPSYLPDDLTDAEFESFWNRHHSINPVIINNPNVCLQVKTEANLFFSIYARNNNFYVAGVKILLLNQRLYTYTIHYISHPLQEIRFRHQQILTLPLTVMSHQKFSVNIENICIQNATFHISFVTSKSRQVIGNVLIFPMTSIDPLEIIIPDVHVRQETNLWIQLICNELSIPLISWLRPHNMIIYPNINFQSRPHIFEFNPTHGKHNDLLWIHGKGFAAKTIRVFFGEENAVVYSCTDNLVKCIVPKNTLRSCNIQVANHDIYETASKPFVYVS